MTIFHDIDVGVKTPAAGNWWGSGEKRREKNLLMNFIIFHYFHHFLGDIEIHQPKIHQK